MQYCWRRDKRVQSINVSTVPCLRLMCLNVYESFQDCLRQSVMGCLQDWISSVQVSLSAQWHSQPFFTVGSLCKQ